MELTDEEIEKLASTIAKSLPEHVKKDGSNWTSFVALSLTMIGLFGGGIGVWVGATSKSTALDVRLTAVETTVVKNGTRIDSLEAARTTTQNSATQITDLKDSFDQFRIQYRDDIKDLKEQVQEAQNRSKK